LAGAFGLVNDKFGVTLAANIGSHAGQFDFALIVTRCADQCRYSTGAIVKAKPCTMVSFDFYYLAGF